MMDDVDRLGEILKPYIADEAWRMKVIVKILSIIIEMTEGVE